MADGDAALAATNVASEAVEEPLSVHSEVSGNDGGSGALQLLPASVCRHLFLCTLQHASRVFNHNLKPSGSVCSSHHVGFNA